MLGGPDRIEAKRLHELAHGEGIIHVRSIRNRRWAGVVLPQQTLPVALVVAGHHHPTVHACAPLPAVVSPGHGPPSCRTTPCATYCGGPSQVVSSGRIAGLWGCRWGSHGPGHGVSPLVPARPGTRLHARASPSSVHERALSSRQLCHTAEDMAENTGYGYCTIPYETVRASLPAL